MGLYSFRSINKVSDIIVSRISFFFCYQSMVSIGEKGITFSPNINKKIHHLCLTLVSKFIIQTKKIYIWIWPYFGELFYFRVHFLSLFSLLLYGFYSSAMNIIWFELSCVCIHVMSWIVEVFFMEISLYTLFVSLVRKCLNNFMNLCNFILCYHKLSFRCNELLFVLNVVFFVTVVILLEYNIPFSMAFIVSYLPKQVKHQFNKKMNKRSIFFIISFYYEFFN